MRVYGMFTCKFCGKECKNNNSLSNHQRLCKDNPDRQYTHFSGEYNRTKVPSNQYIKAKETGIPYILSDETRRKYSITSSGRVVTEETRAKISNSMKIAHSEGRAWNIGMSRWNNEPSYPETFFMKVIENEFTDKDYKREFPIGKYSADFCWVHLKKIIEIDGDQHHRFAEYIRRDIQKDEYLSSAGYQILRITWKDMFSDPKGEIKKAFNFIHN